MEIFEKATNSEHEKVLFARDSASGYRGIIAIHSTLLGPAVGGTRFWNYANEEEALTDALRLSRGMTYPLEAVFDPTGAGDTFAGGFMGYLASQDQLDDAAMRRAMIFGSVMASFNVEEFGTERVRRLTHDEINERFRAFKQMTSFEEIPFERAVKTGAVYD
jgi:hypothetical protein